MILRWVHLLLWSLVLAGCATSPPAVVNRAPFEFSRDTFAYPNELVWEYHFDPQTSQRTTQRREPPSQYSHHCFVVARAARQFFQHARFDASRPTVDAAAYRGLIRQVMARSPSRDFPDTLRVVIPGYADLRAFSEGQAALLKAECGGAWQSYLQRGHWRMIMPLSRGHQERMASQLLNSLKQNRPPVVHIVRFPQLSINHAVLLFAAEENDQEIVFSTYDPNEPTKATKLTYDRASRTFVFPRNLYFAGGRVDVYEIYRGNFY